MKKCVKIMTVFLVALMASSAFAQSSREVEFDSFLVRPAYQSDNALEGRLINKVAIIMGSKLSISNIRDAIIHSFSDYKIKFAADGTDIEVILAGEYLNDKPITHLKLIDHGLPGLLEHLDPFDIPDGASIWMAPSAVVEVYACNYGHGSELFRKNLSRRLLEMYGGILISYKGWVFPFTVISPTENGEEDTLFVNIMGVTIPRLSWPESGANHKVIDTIEGDEDGTVKRYMVIHGEELKSNN